MTHPKLFAAAIVIVVLILIKIIWMLIFCGTIGTFESEKKDILQRRNYLIEKVITTPEKLLGEMPAGIGSQFQGEWALYTCSMTTAALVNIAELYPETKEESIRQIDSLISIALSEDIRDYDWIRWREDPLESLDGDKSHISYLSHIAWMISGYKHIGGSSKYDRLFHSLCHTMNRRILQSKNLNLQTYPRECIYIPDMLVAIVALNRYSEMYHGKYYLTVSQWLKKAKADWMDEKTGLMASFLSDDGEYMEELPVKGSYSALNCYYLTFIDEKFAKEQYVRLKEVFYKDCPITGFKEYSNGGGWLLGFDVDAGPIMFGLSPTGTAFGIGSTTYFKDFALRKKLLKTAEMAGSTVLWKDKRHYLLADLALVGEAITLAMRTHYSGSTH